MKKILNWLFRESLELNKHWWHRLIKVIFLSIFFLASIASYIAVIYAPDRELMREHNITIKNTLYSFTENYPKGDNLNTVKDFFDQDGEYGLLLNGKVEYISLSSLGKALCVKTPEKYLDGISEMLLPVYKENLSYEQSQKVTLSDFTEHIRKQFSEDTTRKCYFFDLDTYDENLKKITNLSANIINYKPNIIFYIEATIVIPILSVLWFIFFALMYYRVFLYIIYGNKK